MPDNAPQNLNINRQLHVVVVMSPKCRYIYYKFYKYHRQFIRFSHKSRYTKNINIWYMIYIYIPYTSLYLMC